MKKYALFALFLISLCHLPKAQLPAGMGYPQVINFSKQEYGASNQNWSMDQGPNGWLYVANNQGLLVYDGGTWQTYELPGQQIVRSVAVDGKGRVYTGAFAEFGYWERSTFGNLKYHSLAPLVKETGFRREEIWKILVADSMVFFQSFSTIYIYRGSKISAVPVPGNVMYLFGVKGRFYVQILGKGLYELKGQHFSQVTSGALFQKDEIITILPYKSHGLLLGTVHHGLYVMDNGKLAPLPGPANDLLRTAQINAGLCIDTAVYAIGTIQDGVVIVDAGGNILYHINQQKGLQNNTVLSLKKDNYGNLWAALDKGIDEIVLRSPFRYFKDMDGTLGSVYCVAVFGNRLFVGTNHGLFYCPVKNEAATLFTTSSFVPIAGLEGQVWSLSVHDGQLLCGHNKGTFRIDGLHAVRISDISGGWDVKQLKRCPGSLMQGTYNGLVLYKKNQRGLWVFSHVVKGSETLSANNWIEDAKGNIWISHTYRGIYRAVLTPDGSALSHLDDLTSGHGLSALYKQRLLPYGNSVRAISTDGIYKPVADRDGSSFFVPDTLLNARLGPYATSRRLIATPNGGIWMVKEDDLLFYRTSWRADAATFSFYQKDFSLVGGYENITPLGSRYAFLCGENGFAIFDMQSPMLQPAVPSFFGRILFSRQGQTVSIDHFRDPDGRFILPYGQDNLSVFVSEPVFDRKIFYRFQLLRDGEAENGQQWEATAQKSWSHLPAGKYVLRVQTNVHAAVASMAFEILPPWYWNGLSKAVYMLALILVLYFLYRLIQKRHRQHFAAHQREMEEKFLAEKLRNERELLLLQQKQLQQEVQVKSEDLANSAAELIKRKKLLAKMHTEIEKLREQNEAAAGSANMRKLSRELERQLKLDKEESRLFETGFNKVHEDFFAKLMNQFPELTPQDLKLAAYLRMNLGSKEIAPLLNITVRGVELKRYRLRKKMNLPAEGNLNEFMMKL